MSDAAYSGVVMPIYQGVSGSRHVLAVDWHIEVELPDGRRFGISIKKGFEFDGASIPRALWRVCGHPLEVPRVAAALAHDFIYASHLLDRETADVIYREICRMVYIAWLRRSVEYYTLRLFGSAAWYSHEQSDIAFARSHGAVELMNEKEIR